MRHTITAFALSAAALACFAPNLEAAEIDFEYQVFAADVPTHAVWVYKPGRRVLDSVHWSLADAEAREAELDADGYTATMGAYRPSKQWLYANSEYLRTFDDYDDAVDFALLVEAKTGLHAWIKTVEVIPGGP